MSCYTRRRAGIGPLNSRYSNFSVIFVARCSLELFSGWGFYTGQHTYGCLGKSTKKMNPGHEILWVYKHLMQCNVAFSYSAFKLLLICRPRYFPVEAGAPMNLTCGCRPASLGAVQTLEAVCGWSGPEADSCCIVLLNYIS